LRSYGSIREYERKSMFLCGILIVRKVDREESPLETISLLKVNKVEA